MGNDLYIKIGVFFEKLKICSHLNPSKPCSTCSALGTAGKSGKALDVNSVLQPVLDQWNKSYRI
jgi:hypothetical protein